MSVSEKKVGEGQGQRTVTRVTFVWLGLYGTSRDRIPMSHNPPLRSSRDSEIRTSL